MSKIELIRQNLHRSRYKSQASTQITLDDDFIVPDAMDDMEKIIVNSGDVILDSVRNQTERVMIRGNWHFRCFTETQKAVYRHWQEALRSRSR